MKTHFINFDQSILDAGKLILASARNFKWNKLFMVSSFSWDSLGTYLLVLAKQLFRDNFMGSDMEMGILLVFVKGYFFSVAAAARSNAITRFFISSTPGKAKLTGLDTKKSYHYQQAA